MRERGQSSIEYLIAVGGIIVLVAIVLTLILGGPNSGPAPECSVECGNLLLTAIDREETCNDHAMEQPNICGGKCFWLEDQCVYEP